MTAEQYIQHLELQAHPEGGFYKELYRSSGIIPPSCLPGMFTGNRSFSTAIYYLLQKGDFSAFHRLKSDECWHFYVGGTLLIHIVESDGTYHCTRLGNNVQRGERFLSVVAAGVWFAAEPAPGTNFALAGCTMAPGFDFADFEMAEKETLRKEYPQHQELVERLCRG